MGMFLKIKEEVIVGTCSTYGRNDNTYKMLVRKHESNRPPGRLRCR